MLAGTGGSSCVLASEAPTEIPAKGVGVALQAGQADIAVTALEPGNHRDCDVPILAATSVWESPSAQPTQPSGAHDLPPFVHEMVEPGKADGRWATIAPMISHI